MKHESKQDHDYRALRAFKPTADDWYPSYYLEDAYKGQTLVKLVEVSLINLSDGKVRVCVWGADDCGMERDYPHHEGSAARSMFLLLLEQKTVDKKFLEMQGFGPA